MSRPSEVSQRELRGLLLDPSLSLAAKGLLHALLLRPPGAVLTRAELFATNHDQMATIDAAIQELAQASLAVKIPPRKRSQGRESGGVKLAAPVVHQPQPEPDSGAMFGARPAPGWWQVWQVPTPLERRVVQREGRG